MRIHGGGSQSTIKPGIDRFRKTIPLFSPLSRRAPDDALVNFYSPIRLEGYKKNIGTELRFLKDLRGFLNISNQFHLTTSCFLLYTSYSSHFSSWKIKKARLKPPTLTKNPITTRDLSLNNSKSSSSSSKKTQTPTQPHPQQQTEREKQTLDTNLNLSPNRNQKEPHAKNGSVRNTNKNRK